MTNTLKYHGVVYQAIATTRTYVEAKNEILKLLQSKGWQVKSGLKIEHATSPDGNVRLWFKAQSIYMTKLNDPVYSGGNGRHNFGDARSLTGGYVDIRKEPADKIVAWIERAVTEKPT